jgi:hypothetical protein
MPLLEHRHIFKEDPGEILINQHVNKEGHRVDWNEARILGIECNNWI